MNARQKAKKLKKEIERLKADRTNGFTWLKIDGIRQKEEPSCLWYDNIPIYRSLPITYEVQIGHMRAEFTPESPDDMLMTLEEHIKRYDDRAKSIRNAIVEKKESQEVVELLRELKAYKEKPMYLWFPINKKLPNQYQHVIAILRSGAEVETYLAHEMWHIVDGVRVNFGDVVFWRHKEVNADEESE